MQRETLARPSLAHLRDLRRIPGIGKSLAQDLWDLGYHTVTAIAGQDPEKMYHALEALRGTHMDPCVLYTFRCAVYFASHDEHDPELLKWWNWKTIPQSQQ
jgi:hypothetical protein